MIVIDTETGGLDPATDALVSVAAVNVETGEQVVWLVKPYPGLRLQPEAEKVHGYSREILEVDGISEVDVCVRFAQWLQQWPAADIGGANPAFDREFINAAMRRNGIPFAIRRVVDIQSLAWLADRMGLLTLEKKGGRALCSLDSILAAMGRSRSGQQHSAIEDVMLTAYAYRRLMTLFRTIREVQPC